MSVAKSKIAWTESTWNPTRGCSRVSAGCMNCYAERTAARFRAPGQGYHGLVKMHVDGLPRWIGVMRELPEALDQPLRWRTPRRIFCNSMSDLFHEGVSDDWLDKVFAVMALCPQHTFQILTKRPERMLAYLSEPWRMKRVLTDAVMPMLHARADVDIRAISYDSPHWPLPNVWLGPSVENQETADERIPLLLRTPAAVRMVSYEPALAPIDFNDHRDWLTPAVTKPKDTPRLDWIIVGGESGSGARPFDLAWARSTVRQCRDAGVAVFVKQLGARPRVDIDDIGMIPMNLRDRKGADPLEWPKDLRVQEYPDNRKDRTT